MERCEIPSCCRKTCPNKGRRDNRAVGFEVHEFGGAAEYYGQFRMALSKLRAIALAGNEGCIRQISNDGEVQPEPLLSTLDLVIRPIKATVACECNKPRCDTPDSCDDDGMKYKLIATCDTPPRCTRGRFRTT